MPLKASDGGGKYSSLSSAASISSPLSSYALNSGKEYNYVFQISEGDRQLICKYKDILNSNAAHFAEIIYDNLFSNPETAKTLYKYESNGGSNADLIKGLLNHLFVILDDDYSHRDLKKELSFITTLMEAEIKPAWILGCYCSLLDHLMEVITASSEIDKNEKENLLSTLIRMIFKCYSNTSDVYWGAVLEEIPSNTVSNTDNTEKLQEFFDSFPQCLWTVDTTSEEISFSNPATTKVFQQVTGPVPDLSLMTNHDQSCVSMAWEKAKQGEEVQVSVSLKSGEQTNKRYRLSFYPTKNSDLRVNQVQCLMEPAQANTSIESSALSMTFMDNNSSEFSEEQILTAIDKNQFELHYQPNIRASDGSIHSVEALIRWRHPELGVIQPGEFIPLVEEYDLMESVTRWVMLNALIESKKWSGGASIIPVSVNFPYGLFNSDSLPEIINEVLQETNTTSEHLQIEISDRFVMSNYDACIAAMTRVNSMGIKIAIDDFGTGNLSFNRLKTFPVQILKIDNLFMESLNNQQQDTAVIRSMIELGHNLGCKVIAEGVENQNVFDCLSKLGCDFMQGYHISEPLPDDSMFEWMMSDIRH